MDEFGRIKHARKGEGLQEGCALVEPSDALCHCLPYPQKIALDFPDLASVEFHLNISGG